MNKRTHLLLTAGDTLHSPSQMWILTFFLIHEVVRKTTDSQVTQSHLSNDPCKKKSDAEIAFDLPPEV